MTRVAAILLGAGVVAAGCWLLAGAAPASYLAAWLCWAAAPLGALPLVMALEIANVRDWPPLVVLRRMLLLLPAVALLMIPILMWQHRLYLRPDMADPLPAAWMAAPFFIGRAIVILGALSVLALVFSRQPARPRYGLGWFGLVLHLCLASVAAVDWVMALQPGLGSSLFGLLLIALHLATAASLALLVTAIATRRAPMATAAGPLLAGCVLVAGFLGFVQFLVVWSANLPHEVAWYLARVTGLGGAVVWFGVVAGLAGLVLLLTPLARWPAGLASLAAMVLCACVVQTLWLVTPSLRGSFTLTLGDCLAVLGLGGIVTGLLLALLPRAVLETGDAV